MTLDSEVDSAYPQRWIGKVKVHLQNGQILGGRVDHHENGAQILVSQQIDSGQ